MTRGSRRRHGVALVAVLYFLVLAALTSIAVTFGVRLALRSGAGLRDDATLIEAGDAVLHGELARWNGAEWGRQRLGSTVTYQAAAPAGVDATVSVTRLGFKVYAMTVDVRARPAGPARQLGLFVRVPIPAAPTTAALHSAADVSIENGVRLIATDSGRCADTASASVIVPAGVTVTLDPALPDTEQPSVRVDPSANDSASYLQIGEWTWSDLAARADVRLAPDAHVTPAPTVSAGRCMNGAENWGEPLDSTSSCFTHAPLVYVPGDLTIDGGRGQGVLLVDGRLVIDGAFTYSGQIVVRRGIETRADAISISGAVYAWRTTSDSSQTRADRGDVVLTHGASLRYSRCDAAHGIQSWLQPRGVRSRAWTELF